MSFFPWILLWISLPLIGSLLIFLTSLDKDRSKKVALWCIGWFLVLSLYLILFRPGMSEYYSFLDLYLKVDSHILWAAVAVVGLTGLCIFIEGRIALGLGLSALLCLCLVIHQWVWFWAFLECVFIVNILFFALAIRTHKILIDSFWRHLICSLFMALFLYTTYWDSATFQNTRDLTARSLVYMEIGLLSYTPVWPVFGMWNTFFSKSNLLGKIMLGVFFWLLFFSTFRGQKVHQEIYYAVLGLSGIGMAANYRKHFDLHSFLIQFVFMTGPLYFSTFLHHSFDCLVLFMVNTGIILGMVSILSQFPQKKSIFFYTALAWAVAQPLFFVVIALPFFEKMLFIGLGYWVLFCFLKSIPKNSPLWIKNEWALGLMAWNLFFPLIYEFVS